jgi:glycosyltransferase involved in cell wall biosynthesis
VVSLVVVAKNEEDRIGRCLRSLQGDVERIVVLDASTTDRTAQIAQREGARVVIRPWEGHVAQKNAALQLASRPFVLSLDADEWLAPEAAAEVLQATASPGRDAGWSFPRCSSWLGREIRSGRWYPDRKVRLVRRGAGRWVGDNPHDRLEVEGAVRRLRGEILHEPYRTIWEHLSTIDRYTAISARTLAERGVRGRAWDVWLRPPLHFVDATLRRGAWRDGADGVALAALGAAYVYLKYSRLRAMQR